jgi:UDP:flavonoid glycosyltransferase YjiC (YdhE family)
LKPQFVDGPANAARVAELGAGIVVGDDIAHAVHTLLEDASYRAAAEGVAETMRALPPVEAALELFSRTAGSAVR